jgi:hypothetical protein
VVARYLSELIVAAARRLIEVAAENIRRYIAPIVSAASRMPRPCLALNRAAEEYLPYGKYSSRGQPKILEVRQCLAARSAMVPPTRHVRNAGSCRTKRYETIGQSLL